MVHKAKKLLSKLSDEVMYHAVTAVVIIVMFVVKRWWYGTA